MADVNVDDNFNITVNFKDVTDYSKVKNDAVALVNSLKEITSDAKLTLDNKTFNLKDDDVVTSVAAAILDGLTDENIQKFIESKNLEKNYKAEIKYKNQEIKIENAKVTFTVD